MRLITLGVVSLALTAIVAAQSALGGQVPKPLEAPEKDRFIKVGGMFAKRLGLEIEPAKWVVTPNGKGGYRVDNGDRFTFVMDNQLMVHEFYNKAHQTRREKHFTPNPKQQPSDAQWISKATDHVTKLWATLGIATTEISEDFPAKTRTWSDNTRHIKFHSVPQKNGDFKYVLNLTYSREDGVLLRAGVAQHGL